MSLKMSKLDWYKPFGMSAKVVLEDVKDRFSDLSFAPFVNLQKNAPFSKCNGMNNGTTATTAATHGGKKRPKTSFQDVTPAGGSMKRFKCKRESLLTSGSPRVLLRRLDILDFKKSVATKSASRKNRKQKFVHPAGVNRIKSFSALYEPVSEDDDEKLGTLLIRSVMRQNGRGSSTKCNSSNVDLSKSKLDKNRRETEINCIKNKKNTELKEVDLNLKLGKTAMKTTSDVEQITSAFPKVLLVRIDASNTGKSDPHIDHNIKVEQTNSTSKGIKMAATHQQPNRENVPSKLSSKFSVKDAANKKRALKRKRCMCATTIANTNKLVKVIKSSKLTKPEPRRLTPKSRMPAKLKIELSQTSSKKAESSDVDVGAKIASNLSTVKDITMKEHEDNLSDMNLQGKEAQDVVASVHVDDDVKKDEETEPNISRPTVDSVCTDSREQVSNASHDVDFQSVAKEQHAIAEIASVMKSEVPIGNLEVSEINQTQNENDNNYDFVGNNDSSTGSDLTVGKPDPRPSTSSAPDDGALECKHVVVDDKKTISDEEMMCQLSDTSDTMTNLSIAPPTKQTMRWEESRTVIKLFASPGHPIPSATLLKLFQRHTCDVDPDDFEIKYGEDEMKVDAEIQQAGMMETGNEPEISEATGPSSSMEEASCILHSQEDTEPLSYPSNNSMPDVQLFVDTFLTPVPEKATEPTEDPTVDDILTQDKVPPTQVEGDVTLLFSCCTSSGELGIQASTSTQDIVPSKTDGAVHQVFACASS